MHDGVKPGKGLSGRGLGGWIPRIGLADGRHPVLSGRGIAGEGYDTIATLGQRLAQPAADKPRCTCDEDSH